MQTLDRAWKDDGVTRETSFFPLAFGSQCNEFAKNPLNPLDSFCPMEKQYLMLKVIMTYYAQVNEAMSRGISLKQIQTLTLKTNIGRMKDIQDLENIRKMIDGIPREVASLEVEK